MAEQLSLVILVVALATGLVTSMFAATHMPARQPEFSRYFLTNILLFNLLVLSGLVFRYLQMALQAPGMGSYSPLLPVLLVLMAGLKLGWLYAFVLMSKILPADIKPKKLPARLAKTLIAVFFIFTVILTLAWFSSLRGLQQATIISLETTVIGGAILAALQLMSAATKLPKDRRRKSILIFAAYHLCLMALILVALILGWLQAGPQSLTQMLTNGGFLVLFNIFPLVWMFGFQPQQAVAKAEMFKSLGITPREQEIIGLIQAGKTNQEIADTLYISLATVKDHNHNIFRKCGTRNRLELARLFQ
jgi:DNA-binding CsgD family transcriptional regulator